MQCGDVTSGPADERLQGVNGVSTSPGQLGKITRLRLRSVSRHRGKRLFLQVRGGCQTTTNGESAAPEGSRPSDRLGITGVISHCPESQSNYVKAKKLHLTLVCWKGCFLRAPLSNYTTEHSVARATSAKSREYPVKVWTPFKTKTSKPYILGQHLIESKSPSKMDSPPLKITCKNFTQNTPKNEQ
jgi:hypothetical protein